MNSRKVLILSFFVMASYSTHAQLAASENPESARRFVQDFYDWYAPAAVEASDHNKEFNWHSKAAEFDPTLLRALKEDEDAQAKANEIVGIDFDPFLSGQDPCAPYKARRVFQDGDHYLVAVDAECKNVTANKPTVTAEVVNRNGRWIFMNFYYPDLKRAGSDLMSILKENRKARQQSSK
jgi:hypothetical protein